MTAAGAVLWAAITIAVAGPQTSPEYLPLWVAQGEGYFAQEKLEVKLTAERSEAEAALALAHGRADMAATSLDAAYRLGHVQRHPPPLLFGLTAAAPVAIVISPSHKDTIRSLRELRGQPVGLPGIGTPEQAALAAVLTHAGVRVHQVPFRSFSGRGLAGALEGGEVAAAVVGEPWISRLTTEGAASILADLRTRADAARWLGAETVHAALFVPPGSGLADGDLAALARALLRAVARVTTASPEALASTLQASVTGRAGDFALRVEGARQSYLPSGVVTDDMLKASITRMREQAPLPAAVKLPWFGLSSLLLTGPLEQARKAEPAPPR